MPDPAGAARAAVDRIPRGERGGPGRKELGGWGGKIPAHLCPAAVLSIHRGWEARDSEGCCSSPPLGGPQCLHSCNNSACQVPSTEGFRGKSPAVHVLRQLPV